MSVAIAVDSLSKKYRLGEYQAAYGTLRETLVHAGRRITRREHHAPAREIWALYDVSFEVPEGQVLGVIGRNGAGKSTLLKTIYGLVPARAGSVRLEGREITRTRADRLTRAGVNFVPQVDNVFPSLSVAENLKVSVLPLPRAERAHAIAEVEELFPIVRARARQRAGSLSGGQRKLLALARAVITRPSLLLLDEPSAGLAPQAVAQVFEKLGEIASLGIGVVMVEQNARRALALSHRGYVLDMGRNAFEGTGEELLADPNVVALYLGSGAGRKSPPPSSSASRGT